MFGCHPLLATRAGNGEVLFARMRHGSANTARGVDQFVDELFGVLNRAGAVGPRFVRADSGFWSWKVIDRLDAHEGGWSVTVPSHREVTIAVVARLATPRAHHLDRYITMIEADRFHPEHAVVEHIPSGHFHANAAWLGCSVLAHNLGIWATVITGQLAVTNQTRRTRLIAMAAAIVNHSGRHLLRFPTGWPWAEQFTAMLQQIRSLPTPASG